MFLEVNDSQLLFEGKVKITFDDILNGIDKEEDDIIYLAGSLVEGFVNKYAKGMGNLYSDIDVFIIREKDKFENAEAEYIEDVRKNYFRNINGFDIDIEMFDKDYVITLQSALKELNISKNLRPSNMLKDKLQVGYSIDLINEFLTRFKNSICIYNKNSYKKFQDNINYTNFLNLKLVNLVANIDNIIDDIKGNLFVKETDTALYSMREAILILMEMALTNEYIYIDRNKWIALKFLNLAKSIEKYNVIHELYTDFFRSDLIDNNTCLNKISYSLSLLQKEVEKIVLGDLGI